MNNWPCAVLVCSWCAATSASAAPPAATAVFPLALEDTSLQGETYGPQADEQHRLTALDAELRGLLVASSCCSIIDLAGVAKQAEGVNMRICNGCDVELARQIAAEISITGWVQKVSNLILNITVVAREVPSGRVIDAGSVDIRGNTDESWSRGLSYLLRNRLHPAEWRTQ